MDPISEQPGPAASDPARRGSPDPADPAAGSGDPRRALEASWIVRTSIFNPYAVIVMALAILVIGSVCLTRIPVDLLPAYKTPAVQVLTLYPGMPAEIVERDMTNRLERWTSQADGVARQESRSMIGVSVLKDYFRDDIDANTAMAQVSALAISDMYYLPPGTVPPMVMPFDPTATLPTALLACSADPAKLDETQVYDLSYFQVRNMLSGTPGVIAPAVFGGRLRRIYIYLDRDKLQAHNLSLMDVHKAIKQSNLMIPTGDAKIGDLQYSINMESMVPAVKDFNNIPIKWEGDQPVLVRDVGKAEDAYAIQTNRVLISEAPTWESKRQVYVPIFRRPGANTIEVAEGVNSRIPEFQKRLTMPAGKEPEDLNLKVVADQSIYVRENINSLLWEAGLGGALASLMILVFLGSVRSTVVIALSIPLSALAAVIGLYFAGQTLNAMTLGGLALVMGRLVDDAIVDVENTVRHLDFGSPPKRAALESAMEIAMPVLVSTITTVAVFIPVIFLSGMAKYLFTPLALSVGFAMFASYILSRTISPAYCAYMLRGDSWFWQALCWSADRIALARLLKGACQGISGAWTGLHRLSEQAQGALNRWYVGSLRAALRVRYLVVLGGLAAFAASFLLYPWIGKELFPQIDAGQFVIGVRAPAGTRLENTEAISQRVEKIIQEEVPAGDRQMIVTNIGVLYDWPAGYTPNAGPMDATMLVQLTPKSEREVSAQAYADRLRERLVREVPGVQFSIDTGGLVSSALNFGLPSPINLQIEGRDLQTQFAVAKRLKEMIGGSPEEAGIPGAVDVRIQETVDYPTIDIDPDRVKMNRLGITQEDAVKNLMSALNSSTSFDPAFWLDYRTGNHYFVGVTYREKDINSLSTLEYAPITGSTGDKPRVLRDVANLKYGKAAVEVSHFNLTRVINVYANISGRDVGAVAADIQEKMAELGPRQTSATSKVPSWGVINRGFSAKERPDEPLAGYTVRMRGEVASMQESFASLGSGLLLAMILIYLIMIAQFRSFLDPFIIMFAVPLGIIGVLATLFLTGTTINVQSFLGVIFMVGIAVSNSILLVEFANRLRSERGLSPSEAAVEAASIRLRPILMTSLAAIIGLLPMALRSGEANTPLARAVIGGLSVSTVLTLFVVPCLYVILKRGPAAPRAEEGY